MHHRAKICANWSNRYQDMAAFRFFKMAACLGPPKQNLVGISHVVPML